MYQKELSIAIKAVKKSEKTFRKYFGTRTKVKTKQGDYRNLVSLADRRIEKDLKTFLLKHFPKFGFIGEESRPVNIRANFVWVADPVDGTNNYLQGLPECSISLALLEQGKPVVGIIFAPIAGKLYTARLGGGAALNGKKIQVASTSDVKFAFGALGWGRDIPFARKVFPKLLPQTFKLRVIGSATMGLGYVAEGKYDYYFDHEMNLWDYAAGEIIIEEAGGKLLLSKKPQLQIAANPILAKKIFILMKNMI